MKSSIGILNSLLVSSSHLTAMPIHVQCGEEYNAGSTLLHV